MITLLLWGAPKLARANDEYDRFEAIANYLSKQHQAKTFRIKVGPDGRFTVQSWLPHFDEPGGVWWSHLSGRFEGNKLEIQKRAIPDEWRREAEAWPTERVVIRKSPITRKARITYRSWQHASTVREPASAKAVALLLANPIQGRGSVDVQMKDGNEFVADVMENGTRRRIMGRYSGGEVKDVRESPGAKFERRIFAAKVAVSGNVATFKGDVDPPALLARPSRSSVLKTRLRYLSSGRLRAIRGSSRPRRGGGGTRRAR